MQHWHPVIWGESGHRKIICPYPLAESDQFWNFTSGFENPADYDQLDQDDVLKITNVRSAIEQGKQIQVINTTKGTSFMTSHSMSQRQVQILLKGGVINVFREKLQESQT